MQITPLTGTLGAEVYGADIRNEADFAPLYEAFKTHSVLVIRGQTEATPEDHIAFSHRFGPINVNRFFKPVAGYPEIATVLKEKDQTAAIGEGWHTDHSYDEAPAMGSLLRAIEVPPYGGDTMFVSMGQAYDTLSTTMQRFLEGLSAWHSSRHVFGETTQNSEAARTGRLSNATKATQNVLHPVVIKHPFSGRKCLFVNPVFTTHIDGLKEAESSSLLKMLYQHCQQPELQARVRWQKGDITIWDNRATWHKAINDYHGFRRYMHRITIEGCNLKGVNA